MATLNLAQAARATGKTRTTIKKWLISGRLSGTRDAEGNWVIDTAELARVGWIAQETGDTPLRTSDRLQSENKELRQQLETLRGQLADKEALAKSYQLASEQHQLQLQRVWGEYYDLKTQLKLLAPPPAAAAPEPAAEPEPTPTAEADQQPPELHIVEGAKAEPEKKRGFWSFLRAA